MVSGWFEKHFTMRAPWDGPVKAAPISTPLHEDKWDKAVDPRGREFWINHKQGLTSWSPPAVSALPPGWDAKRDAQGRLFFVDHNTKRTTWVDPRACSPSASSSSMPPPSPRAAQPPPSPTPASFKDQSIQWYYHCPEDGAGPSGDGYQPYGTYENLLVESAWKDFVDGDDDPGATAVISGKYMVCFDTSSDACVQENVTTGYKRAMRRRRSEQRYPQPSAAPPAPPAAPPVRPAPSAPALKSVKRRPPAAQTWFEKHLRLDDAETAPDDLLHAMRAAVAARNTGGGGGALLEPDWPETGCCAGRFAVRVRARERRHLDGAVVACLEAKEAARLAARGSPDVGANYAEALKMFTRNARSVVGGCWRGRRSGGCPSGRGTSRAERRRRSPC